MARAPLDEQIQGLKVQLLIALLGPQFAYKDYRNLRSDAFMTYIESQCRTYMSNYLRSAFTALFQNGDDDQGNLELLSTLCILTDFGIGQDPMRMAIDLLLCLANAFRKGSTSQSVDEVVDEMLTSKGLADHRPLESEQAALRQTVFAFLGCFSMLWKAHPDNTDATTVRIVRNGQNASFRDRGSIDLLCRRPISAFLRDYFNTLPLINTSIIQQQSSYDASSQIHASSVSFWALQKISRITITWTDDMGQHLDFNPANRRLFLFRYPHFCALGCIPGSTTIGDQYVLPG